MEPKEFTYTQPNIKHMLFAHAFITENRQIVTVRAVVGVHADILAQFQIQTR